LKGIFRVVVGDSLREGETKFNLLKCMSYATLLVIPDSNYMPLMPIYTDDFKPKSAGFDRPGTFTLSGNSEVFVSIPKKPSPRQEPSEVVTITLDHR
jgi:hypothetical protein